MSNGLFQPKKHWIHLNHEVKSMTEVGVDLHEAVLWFRRQCMCFMELCKPAYCFAYLVGLLAFHSIPFILVVLS